MTKDTILKYFYTFFDPLFTIFWYLCWVTIFFLNGLQYRAFFVAFACLPLYFAQACNIFALDRNPKGRIPKGYHGNPKGLRAFFWPSSANIPFRYTISCALHKHAIYRPYIVTLGASPQGLQYRAFFFCAVDLVLCTSMHLKSSILTA